MISLTNYQYIIDLSYIVYFSGSSAFNRYVREFDIPKTQLGPGFDPTLDPDFVDLLERTFRACIENPIQKICPFIDRSRFVFCMDCARKNIWRREFYPEYKLQRDVLDRSKDKYNVGAIFKFAYNKIVPDYCAENNAHIFKCEYAEGDDVIAISAKYFLNMNKQNKVIIVSADKDMVQLCSDRIRLVTIGGLIRDPTTVIEHELKLKAPRKLTADDFLLFKILQGDPSDNIPNIMKGCGKKKAYNLMINRDMLVELLKSDPNIAKSFKRNKALISMKEIPKEIEDLIVESINEELFSKDQDLGLDV